MSEIVGCSRDPRRAFSNAVGAEIRTDATLFRKTRVEVESHIDSHARHQRLSKWKTIAVESKSTAAAYSRSSSIELARAST